VGCFKAKIPLDITSKIYVKFESNLIKVGKELLLSKKSSCFVKVLP